MLTSSLFTPPANRGFRSTVAGSLRCGGLTAELTSAKPTLLPLGGLPLPHDVQRDLNRGLSPVRAWRAHRGLSTVTLMKLSRMSAPSVSAIDQGEIDLCEWTVEAMAKALEITPIQLLQAQLLASALRNNAQGNAICAVDPRRY